MASFGKSSENYSRRSTDHVGIAKERRFSAARQKMAELSGPVLMAMFLLMTAAAIDGAKSESEGKTPRILRMIEGVRNLDDFAQPPLPNQQALLDDLDRQVTRLTIDNGSSTIDECSSVRVGRIVVTAAHCTETAQKNRIFNEAHVSNHGFSASIDRLASAGSTVDIAAGRIAYTTEAGRGAGLDANKYPNDHLPQLGSRFFTSGFPNGQDTPVSTEMIYIGSSTGNQLFFAVPEQQDGSPAETFNGDSGSPIIDPLGHIAVLRGTYDEPDARTIENMLRVDIPDAMQIVTGYMLTTAIRDDLQHQLSTG